MSTADIEIIPATSEKAAELNEVIFQASVGMYTLHGYGLSEIESRFAERHSQERIEKTKKMIEDLSSNERYIVATSAGVIVGLCYAERGLSENTLHAMYVFPEFQGKGIGTLLWRSVAGWLSEKDTYLNVLDMNFPAIKFYKNIGFEFTGKVSVLPGLTHNSMIRDEEMVLRAK